MKLISFLRGLILTRFSQTQKYWESRYAHYGEKAELNLSSNTLEEESLHQQQLKIIEGIYQGKTGLDILDFGCGTGRFSIFLSEFTKSQVVAYDFSVLVSNFQKQNAGVTYTSDFGFVMARKYDNIFISLVLGAMNDADARHTASKLSEALKMDGFIVVAENTSSLRSSGWKFRSVEQYSDFFPGFAITVVAKYIDNGEEITVFTLAR
ncbi:class I SAM-dependent methyltransferase [Gammaproteobacteria bacterium]|nr:class I SAM-dependent methyltransferase [Gammaproteobacteria bacterium]